MRDPIIRTLSNACRCLKECLEADLGIDRQEVENIIKKLNEIRVKTMMEKLSATTRQPRGNHAATKEREAGKENLPPTPPIREKGEEKEATTTTARARACEKKSPHPTLQQVQEFAKEIGATAEWAKAWYAQMERVNEWRHPKNNRKIVNWKRYIQLYWKRREEFDPLPPAKEPAKRVFKAEDWELCAERCRHFDCATCKCKRGIVVPPNCLPQPMPPQECGLFKGK